MMEVSQANTAGEFINAARPLLLAASVEEVDKFVDSVYENFTDMKPSSDISPKDYGVRIFKMLQHSKPPVTGFLSCFIVLSPHSMTVERSVSTYNVLMSNLRTSTNEDTLNDRLLIHWNGVPTNQFNPQEAVQTFLTKKERRRTIPDPNTFCNRDFVKKFFHSHHTT